ncbi:hypothetical protein [Nostoc sp.]|uniref:hypothetical protein n=1 Tax=Nostoc sp. TaxID=1180 RepID=UPI002FF47ABF
MSGTAYNDNIVGNNGNDTLSGGTSGNDTVDGGIRDDLLSVDFSAAKVRITTTFFVLMKRHNSNPLIPGINTSVTIASGFDFKIIYRASLALVALIYYNPYR